MLLLIPSNHISIKVTSSL
ncbi:putative heat shock small membrane protein GndA, partial [Escherichia coli]